MKRLFLLIISFFISLSLYAQTQYDYYDDSAVAGGADRALHGILIIGGIIVVVIVLALLLGGAAKFYFWLNPQEDPKYMREKAANNEESKRVKEQTAQNDSLSDVSEKSAKEEIGNNQEINSQKVFVQRGKGQKNDVKNLENDGFTLSTDGSRLIKGNDAIDCHIPYGVKVVCNRAFKDSSQIRNLYISETVEEVEEYAFSCNSVEKVLIPKSIIKWGKNAFAGCFNLREVLFDSEIGTLGYGMFSLCSSMERIVIPPKIKDIPSNSFEFCRSLCSVTLPKNIEQIGDCAFLGCENLENIELPNSIKRIGNGAFQDCYVLKSIILPASLDGLRDDLFMNCFGIEELIIPEGVLAIGKDCFYNCSALKNIQLPASLLYIDKDAFKDCYGMTIKVPFHSELDDFFDSCTLEDDCKIIRYNAPAYKKTESDKNRLEKFLFEMKYKRNRDDYEFRKEMGLLTKEEFEEEYALYRDMMVDRDYWDDL